MSLYWLNHWPVSFTISFLFTIPTGFVFYPYPHYVVSFCFRPGPVNLHVFVLPSGCYYLACLASPSTHLFFICCNQYLLKSQLSTLSLSSVFLLRQHSCFACLSDTYLAFVFLDTNLACPLLEPCLDSHAWADFGSLELPGTVMSFWPCFKK